MTAVSYQSLALAWQPKNKRDKSFIVFTLFVLILFLGIGLFFSSIKVPEEERRAKIDIPDRIAKFILDKPKPKPVVKPKPTPKKLEKPKPRPEPKPNIKREKPKKIIKLTEKQKTARTKAEKSGLIALSEDLADLMDTSSIDLMVGNPIKKSDKQTQIASVDTRILTAGSQEESGMGSGGNIKPDLHLSPTGGATTLDSEQGTIARKLITARVEEDRGVGGKNSDGSGSTTKVKQARVGNYRSEEDIAYIVDKNKRSLYNIYRRARRSDSGIQGKIVLEITILPSGKVESVRITSSELQNAKLEARIIARVKQFDFGAQNVKKVTVTYPIEFLPS